MRLDFTLFIKVVVGAFAVEAAISGIYGFERIETLLQAGYPDYWWLLPILLPLVIGVLSQVRFRSPGSTTPTITDDQKQRNRQRMLEKIRLSWIDGVLNQSLYKEARMDLGLEVDPGAVDDPLNLAIHTPDREPETLPAGTPMIEVYDDLGKELLILGSPGSGKTTLLLELTRDLIKRADDDALHLIPIVFNLSSWAVKRGLLAEWLVDELNIRYSVQRKIGQAWIDEQAIMPLLDGLDEVAPDHRDACVEAINTFKQQHDLPTVVCSRLDEYQALSGKLLMQSAVVVQPLMPEDIDRYLDGAGDRLVGIRDVYRSDIEMQEVLATPLMLSIAMMAYQGRSRDDISMGTGENRQRQLFETYADTCLHRLGKLEADNRSYPDDKTMHWLSWLAWALRNHNLTEFYLEGMQPDWLVGSFQRRLMRICLGLVFGLVGGLFLGLFFGLFFGLFGGLFFGLFGGLVLGLGLGLVFGLFGGRRAIQCVDQLHFSWSKLQKRSIREIIIVGLFGGLFFGLFGGLYVGLFGGLVLGLGFAIDKALIPNELVTTRSLPNEGIHRSIRNALYVGLGFGLFGGLGFGLFFGLFGGLGFGLGLGPVFGLGFGLDKGGWTSIQHYTLRIILWCYNYTPRNYVRFLDYAAGRLFLRKVGGGYIFVHRLLLDYFADLYEYQNPPDAT